MKEVMEYVKARYLSGLSEKGQGIVEYALILAFIVVIAMAITSGGDLRGKVQNVFSSISTAFGS